MKRVRTILWVLLAVSLSAHGQISHVGGELRYEQRYQDFLYGDNLTKILVKNPVLDLRFQGTLLSPRLVAYSLFTSIDGHFLNTTSPFIDYSSKQYTWNKYNLSLNLFPYSPVKATVAARDNTYDLQTNMQETENHLNDRQQEQRAEVSVQQISWLPTMNVSFVRTRSFSELGFPYDVVNQTLSFSATGSTDTTGSYGLTGTYVDFRDLTSLGYDKFFTLQFSASREIAERHGVNLNAEYEQYTGFSILTGSLLYTGFVNSRLRLMTSLSGNVSQTASWQSRALSFSQSGAYSLTQNLSAGLGVSAFVGNGQERAIAGQRQDEYRTLGSFGYVQYRGMIERFLLTNSLSGGVNQQQYASRYTNFNLSFANSISRPIGAFVLNGYFNVSYVRVQSARFYDVVDNTAGAMLGGTFATGIRSQTDLRYRDTRYPGEEYYRNQRTLFFTQRFNSSFYYVIPFHVSLSASANWYIAGLEGHTYSWSTTFASPTFFIRGLGVDYTYSRSFDPYYRQGISEHQASMSYQWRALVVSTRGRYATFPVRVREVSFKISRYF